MAGLPVSKKNSNSTVVQSSEKTRLECRLEELLSGVEGVGNVEVIIMTGTEGNESGFSMSSQMEVTGVLVAAQGAGSAVTVQNIQQAPAFPQRQVLPTAVNVFRRISVIL